MPMRLDDLRPYVSLQLARILPGGRPAGLLAKLMRDVKDELKVRNAPAARRVLIQDLDEARTGEFYATGVVYRGSAKPTWLGAGQEGAALEDIEHQLVLVCRFERLLAFHATESAAIESIARLLERKTREGFVDLERIPPPIMNAAFIKGDARTLWLSGIHTSVRHKADSKILSGPSLQDALDPLADQTFTFTAARCASTELRRGGAGREAMVGVSPRGSRIWIGPSRSWEDFSERTLQTLKVLKRTQLARRQIEMPLPVLASPVRSLAEVEQAFDVSFYPPELLLEDVTASGHLQEQAERWGFNSSFEVLATDGPSLEARLLLDGQPLGDLRIEVTMAPSGEVSHAVGARDPHAANEPLFEEGVRLAGRGDWLRVRYDSGHTYTHGAIYSMAFRDGRFEAWDFAHLPGTDVGKEKPTSGARGVFTPSAVGSQDSLFCWVANSWAPPGLPAGGRRGWLICDDGQDEVADFVHVDLGDGSAPQLNLIHVKAANSTSATRSLSVSAYEVVTGQAVKNLRFLDRGNLADIMEGGRTRPVGALVWKDGQRVASRDGVIRDLRSHNARFTKRVIVLQPHITRQVYTEARDLMIQGSDDRRVRRLHQLDALLLAAQAECRGLGAELLVVGQG